MNDDKNDKTVVLTQNKADLNDEKTIVQSSSVEEKTVLSTDQSAQSFTESGVLSPKSEIQNFGHVGLGSIINKRFVLDKQLGFGGMGTVYRAIDKRKQEANDENPYVAIKLLGEDFKHHPKAFITLQRETKKTQQLAHPNIVTVHDFDRDGDIVYMTMEELKGQNLEELLKDKTSNFIGTKRALTIIRKIAAGLSYAHSKGIVHSDLKPGNIFITEDGNVKVLDFGIARVVENNADTNRFDAGELGALSPCYASVEMINHLPPDPKDDIYALGIIACELLTGHHPYKREIATVAAEKKMMADTPGVGRLLKRALRSAVVTDISARVESCDVFINRLDFATGGYKKWIAGGVLALCFLVGNIVYLEHAKEPELALSDLTSAQQQQFAKFMEEASTAIRFGDVNGGLFYMDKAYAIHSQNQDISNFIELVLSKIEANIKEQALKAEEIEAIVQTLSEYTAFQNDKSQEALNNLSN